MFFASAVEEENPAESDIVICVWIVIKMKHNDFLMVYDLIRLLYGATTYLTSLARGGTGSTHALSENRMIDLIYYYVLMCKRHNTCYVRRCGRSTGAVVTSVGGTSCAAQRQ